MLRRQRDVVNPHIVNLPLEPVVRASAPADPQRVSRLKILIHVVQMDRELLRSSIDVNLDALGGPRSVVGHHHVLPAIELDRLHGLDSRSIVQPAQDQVGLNLPVLQIQTIPGLFLDIFRARDDGAGVGGRIDPRRQRELVLKTEGADVAAKNEALAVEAGCLADTARRKLRLPVLELAGAGVSAAWAVTPYAPASPTPVDVERAEARTCDIAIQRKVRDQIVRDRPVELRPICRATLPSSAALSPIPIRRPSNRFSAAASFRSISFSCACCAMVGA